MLRSRANPLSPGNKWAPTAGLHPRRPAFPSGLTAGAPVPGLHYRSRRTSAPGAARARCPAPPPRHGPGPCIAEPASPRIRPIDWNGETSRRLDAVRSVLVGESPGDVLGYPLGGAHLASVAWGRKALESLRPLAWELSGRDLLSVQVDQETAWGWVELSDGSERGVRRRLRGFAPP